MFQRPSVRRRSPALVLVLLGASLAACSAAPAADENVGEAASALYGTTYTAEGFWASGSCPAYDAILHRAMNVGRFVAKTEAFTSCVAAHYRRCALDRYPFSEPGAVIMGAQKPNDTVIHCADLPGTVRGRVTGGVPDDINDLFLGIPGGLGLASDMHDLTYTGREDFAIDKDFLAKTSGWDAAGNRGALYTIASVIWHEASHVYGFSHGHNSDAAKAKTACGRDGDPSWDWQLNSGPNAVKRCMVGAFTAGGNAAPAPVLGAPEEPVESSLVRATFAKRHKRMYPMQHESILAKIESGTYAPADLEREATRNGTWGSATPVTLGTSLYDELTGPPDADYWVIDIPTKMDVRVTIESRRQDFTMPSPDTVGPLPDVELEPYYAKDPAPTKIAFTTTGTKSVSTFTVWPSRFYIKASNASAFTSFQITIEEAKMQVIPLPPRPRPPVIPFLPR